NRIVWGAISDLAPDRPTIRVILRHRQMQARAAGQTSLRDELAAGQARSLALHPVPPAPTCWRSDREQGLAAPMATTPGWCRTGRRDALPVPARRRPPGCAPR